MLRSEPGLAEDLDDRPAGSSKAAVQQALDSLSQRERVLLLKIKSSEDESKSMQLRHRSEVERMRHELVKHQQGSGGHSKQHSGSTDLLENEFDQEQKIERMRSEIARLKRANQFLRERSALFDKMSEEAGKPFFSSDDGEAPEDSHSTTAGDMSTGDVS